MPPAVPARKTRFILIIAVFLVALLGILAWTSVASFGGLWRGQTAITFETVDEGQNGVVTERKNYIIKSDVEWKDLWGLVHGAEQPMPEAPNIDFSQYRILVAFQGERPSGGYKIQFNTVVDTGGALEVFVKEQEPGEGCATTAVMTAPYQIVKIPKSDKSLISHSEREVVACQ